MSQINFLLNNASYANMFIQNFQTFQFKFSSYIVINFAYVSAMASKDPKCGVN